jgi:PAS domain S-box-containing protein
MSTDRVNVLLVDDQPSKLLTYEVILRDLGENLVKSHSAREALECLLRTDVAVILVDVSMPELDGFQFAAMVRDHPRFEKTPIIFISAIHVSEMDRVRGYEKGAVDYVPVPVVPEILRAKVRVFVELHRKTRQLEALNRELEARVANRTEALEASLTQLRESEERLRLASEAAGFGTYDYNPETDRIHCSGNLKWLLGIEAEDELSLDGFLAAIHPADREAMRSVMHSVRDSVSDRHELEFRATRSDGSVRWMLDRGRVVQHDGLSGGRVMGTILDITVRKMAEERQYLLMAELDHRVKNVLANVSAIARLSATRANSVKHFVDALDGRIQAMSRAHGLLRRGNWDGADLRELVADLLSPFRAVESGNIEIAGDLLQLGPKAAQSLALVLHELATNAVKYGALSAPAGRINVGWTRLPGKPGCIRLTWIESGGPLVSEPSSMGFGFTALQAAAAEFGAELDYSFRRQGLICSLEGPFEQVGGVMQRRAEAAALNGSGAQAGLGAAAPPVGGCRILIVEDEPLVALQLQSDLESDGHQVVGPGASLAQGLALAAKADMDIALLDVSLGADISAPIADQLIARYIPFAFATGYADDTLLPAHLRGIPRLAKPYVMDDVRRIIGQLIATGAAGSGDPADDGPGAQPMPARRPMAL